MSEKGLNSPVFRRIITIALFAGISAALLSLYYLVFLPQQHEQFNERTFRILREITNNFSLRVSNYGTSYSNAYIGNKYKEAQLTIADVRSNNSGLAETFKKTFTGKAERIDSFVSVQRIVNDSIVYEIKKGGSRVSTPGKSLNEILDPLISIHANTFESVLLIKQKADTIKGGKAENNFDSILYRSAGANITGINTDSLLLNKNIEASAINDIQIEGVDYKLFVYPFQVKAISNGTFVIAGLITQKSYRQQSQSVPLNFLFGIGFFLILMLLALPFIKIFVLSTHENITIADVRLIVAVIFVIPFVITLFTSVIWLYKYPGDFSTDVLTTMQDSIKDNFYKEIQQCVRQVKDYNVLMNDPAANVALEDSLEGEKWKDSSIDSLDVKDIFFYPRYYKNFQSVHWMNADGNDVAVWSFIKQPATYFKLGDRQYFTDIKYRKGCVLPGSNDTFSIQPALSRLTGEYTVNIAIASRIALPAQKTTTAVSLSAKMYSLYNTVVPLNYGYCLIDEKGDLLSHSDTARNLQENLFEETEDNHLLHLAVNHKDSLLIDDINLYDQPVKMMIKPLPGLPYYLVTYYEKRGEYLFITHVLAFVFLCESIVLLFVSLFSYCIMVMDKKLFKLLFIPDGLNWIKPSIYKKEYYIKNSFQLLVCLILVFLFSLFFPSAYYYLYMLNASLLLPLFCAAGYYIIKRARVFTKGYKNDRFGNSLFLPRPQFLKFLKSIKNILVLYILSVIIFGILQNVLLYDTLCGGNIPVKIVIWLLIVIMPFIMCLTAVTNFRVLLVMIRNITKKFSRSGIGYIQQKPSKNNYLTHFIVSLLISVLVVSIIPAVTFTGYALHEERKLHFQSFQVELAKKIQQRRTEMNSKLWQTKVLQLPAEGNSFIDSLKFKKDKGLYIYSNELSKETFVPDTSAYNSCSPFYRLLTQFLFLPPDHDEFYDNPFHNAYYSWKESFDEHTLDSLQLSYKNLTDYRDSSSIVLKAGIPHFYIFKDITQNPAGLLVMLALLVLAYLFYRVIYSVAKRVFLVGYFEHPGLKYNSSKHSKTGSLTHTYSDVTLTQLCQPFFPEDAIITFEDIRKKENELLENDKDGGEAVLKLHLALIPVYENKWEECSDIEKFTLYDFALDGFTNYKKVITLYNLYQKGLLVKEDENFTLMTKSFRNFLITKETSEEIERLSRQVKGSWSTLRSVFYVILIAVAVFIFISQEEASKRLIAIITSLAALLPVMLKLFDKSTFGSSPAKSEKT